MLTASEEADPVVMQPIETSVPAGVVIPPEPATAKESGSSSRSLQIVIVVENPFDPEVKERPVDEHSFMGDPTSDIATFLSDDDFLRKPGRGPTRHQKLIEMLLRFRARGLHVTPDDVLERIPEDMPFDPSDVNSFHGYRLAKNNMCVSPDKDEAYFKVYMPREVMLRFAEDQSVVLRTNPYSSAGGAGMIFSRRMEDELARSVSDYATVGKVPKQYIGTDGKGWGFYILVPQKMRLSIRFLREAWVFGGCGIQLDELRAQGVFIKNYFPQHSEDYQKKYKLEKWASFKALLNPRNFFRQDESALVHYFGESVALYFVWLHSYTKFLFGAAAFALVLAIIDEAGVSTSIVGSVFSFLIVLWGMLWIRYWRRREALFSADWGQNVEIEQELVRDEFQAERPRTVAVTDIFSLRFSVPLTIQRRPDGTMVELYYPSWKRFMWRYLVAYPVTLFLTAAMIAALIFTTNWRFDHVDDEGISLASSIISVAISSVFGALFSILVPKLNALENNRTQNEEENQLILKTFFFNYFSSYFALFIIALWPNLDGQQDFSPTQRLDQLRTQMITICVIKPAVQNAQELIINKALTILRRNTDQHKGNVCLGLGTTICCCGCNGPEPPQNASPRQVEGFNTWKEAQRAQYVTTSDDFLEIALQFGFMCMFAAVFPWGPVCSLFWNLIELRVDAIKLLHTCQRPIARARQSIGAWNGIFVALLCFSVITNSYFITILSPAPSKVGLPNEDLRRYQYFILLQYMFIAVLLLFVLIWGGTPDKVEKMSVRANLVRDRALRARLREMIHPESTKKHRQRHGQRAARLEVENTAPF